MVEPRTYQKPRMCGLVQQNYRSITRLSGVRVRLSPVRKRMFSKCVFLWYSDLYIQISFILVTRENMYFPVRRVNSVYMFEKFLATGHNGIKVKQLLCKQFFFWFREAFCSVLSQKSIFFLLWLIYLLFYLFTFSHFISLFQQTL